MRVAIALVVLAALTALPACATSGSAVAGRPLDGVEWRLVHLPGSGGVPAAPADEAPYLRFDADSSRVGGNTGCNLLGGPYTRDGALLSFGPLVTTRRACIDPARNATEASFVNALQATRRWTIERDTLVLSSDTAPVARLVAR